MAHFATAFGFQPFVWNGKSHYNAGNEQNKNEYEHQHTSEVLVK